LNGWSSATIARPPSILSLSMQTLPRARDSGVAFQQSDIRGIAISRLHAPGQPHASAGAPVTSR
jgi:hypothetical protein